MCAVYLHFKKNLARLKNKGLKYLHNSLKISIFKSY